jgi:chaperonin GroES
VTKLKQEHVDLVLETIAGIEVLGLRFIGPRVAVLHDPALEVTKGGIIIPETAQRRLPSGIVVALGNGIGGEDVDEELHLYRCKVGDRVVISKYGGGFFSIELPNGRLVEIESISPRDIYIITGTVFQGGTACVDGG